MHSAGDESWGSQMGGKVKERKIHGKDKKVKQDPCSYEKTNKSNINMASQAKFTLEPGFTR